MAEEKPLSFEEILDSVPTESMMKPFKALSSAELKAAAQKEISPETQRLYLAYYAKAAHEHVGFEGFSPENQSKFKQTIEKLYADISKPRKQGEFLEEMALHTTQYIEGQTL